MSVLCPFCGHKLIHKIKDGITTCDNCGRIVISSVQNKLLSAAWNVRNWHVEDLDTLQKQCELTEDELLLVKKWVVDKQLLHEEFVKVLKTQMI